MAENEPKPDAGKPGVPPQQSRPKEGQGPTGSPPEPGRVTLAEAKPDGKKGATPSPALTAEQKREFKRAARGNPPRPTPDELEQARKDFFGDEPGAVRLAMTPENSGPNAEPTKFVFVDGFGRVVGEREYVPATPGPQAKKG